MVSYFSEPSTLITGWQFQRRQGYKGETITFKSIYLPIIIKIHDKRNKSRILSQKLDKSFPEFSYHVQENTHYSGHWSLIRKYENAQNQVSKQYADKRHRCMHGFPLLKRNKNIIKSYTWAKF